MSANGLGAKFPFNTLHRPQHAPVAKTNTGSPHRRSANFQCMRNSVYPSDKRRHRFWFGGYANSAATPAAAAPCA